MCCGINDYLLDFAYINHNDNPIVSKVFYIQKLAKVFIRDSNNRANIVFMLPMGSKLNIANTINYPYYIKYPVTNTSYSVLDIDNCRHYVPQLESNIQSFGIYKQIFYVKSLLEKYSVYNEI